MPLAFTVSQLIVSEGSEGPLFTVPGTVLGSRDKDISIISLPKLSALQNPNIGGGKGFEDTAQAAGQQAFLRVGCWGEGRGWRCSRVSY